MQMWLLRWSGLRRSCRVRFFMVLLVAATSGLVIDGRDVLAHGGGLDSDGGHNCNVGGCAGTYHCHRAWGPRCGGATGGSGGSSSSSSTGIAACVSEYGSYFTRSEIARIQKSLAAGGYRPGPIDGVYGKQTRAALNRFEKKKRLRLSIGQTLRWTSLSRLGVVC